MICPILLSKTGVGTTQSADNSNGSRRKPVARSWHWKEPCGVIQ